MRGEGTQGGDGASRMIAHDDADGPSDRPGVLARRTIDRPTAPGQKWGTTVARGRWCLIPMF